MMSALENIGMVAICLGGLLMVQLITLWFHHWLTCEKQHNEET